MKKAKVYMQSKHCSWYCTKCGHCHPFQIEPQGIFCITGTRLADKSAIKKGYFIGVCDHRHMGVQTCRARRKVMIGEASFGKQSDKFTRKMGDRLSKTLKKEDKIRNANLEVTIRAKVKKEFEEARKAKEKQIELFKKGKKKRKGKKRK